jgi:hypothetical protein
LKASYLAHDYAVKAELDEMNRSLEELLITLRSKPFNAVRAAAVVDADAKELSVKEAVSEATRIRWD